MKTLFRFRMVVLTAVIVVLVHLVSSCASGVSVTVSRPPLVDLGEAKTATVLPFLYGAEGQGENPLDALFEGYAKYHSTFAWRSSFRRSVSEKLGAAIGETIAQKAGLEIIEPAIIKAMISSSEPPSIQNAQQKNGKLKRPTAAAVVRPGTESAADAEAAADAAAGEKSEAADADGDGDAGFFKKLAQKFGQSGTKAVKDDPDQNFEEVWLRGAEFADVAVLGKVRKTSFWIEDATREGRDDNAKAIIIPGTRKTFEFAYTLWVYRLADGAVLGSMDVVQTIVSEKEGSGSFLKVDSDEDMLNAAISASMVDVARLFAPYSVRERRVFAKDPTKNARIAEAVKHAKKGEYRAALKLCDAVYAETELDAAGYNAALFAELSGDLAGAIGRMERLDASAGSADTARELQRLKGRLAESARLK